MEDKLFDTSEQKERIIVVGVANSDNDDTEKSLDELIELGQTAGVETVAKVIQNREKIHPGTYIGKGKIEEVRELVIKHHADTVVCYLIFLLREHRQVRVNFRWNWHSLDTVLRILSVEEVNSQDLEEVSVREVRESKSLRWTGGLSRRG